MTFTYICTWLCYSAARSLSQQDGDQFQSVASSPFLNMTWHSSVRSYEKKSIFDLLKASFFTESLLAPIPAYSLLVYVCLPLCVHESQRDSEKRTFSGCNVQPLTLSHIFWVFMDPKGAILLQFKSSIWTFPSDLFYTSLPALAASQPTGWWRV